MRPLPLALAKSCKGGDVSVLDPALAWDVRCIYLFICLWAPGERARGARLTLPCPINEELEVEWQPLGVVVGEVWSLWVNE